MFIKIIQIFCRLIYIYSHQKTIIILLGKILFKFLQNLSNFYINKIKKFKKYFSTKELSFTNFNIYLFMMITNPSTNKDYLILILI